MFADYLVHRYANPSFLAATGPLLVLARTARRPAAVDSTGHVCSGGEASRPVRVLDLACGAGHASYLMRLVAQVLSIVSADLDFVNVYLARRYLVPDGLHLCIDAQVPSPFPDRHFDAEYCQDAFHYFQSKKAAVDELKSIAHPDALWVFNLTLVRGGGEVWRIHRDFPEAFCRQASALQVNPIYRARPKRNGVLLERRWPNPVMTRECAEAETLLPESCRLGSEQLLQLKTGWTGSTPGWLEDLVARFVLVPLPHG